MATTKAKKAPAKKTTAKKALSKKAQVKKTSNKKSVPAKKTVRSTTTSRRPFITRTDEYTQLTWILISVWVALAIIFLGTVIGKTG